MPDQDPSRIAKKVVERVDAAIEVLFFAQLDDQRIEAQVDDLFRAGQRTEADREEQRRKPFSVTTIRTRMEIANALKANGFRNERRWGKLVGDIYDLVSLQANAQLFSEQGIQNPDATRNLTVAQVKKDIAKLIEKAAGEELAEEKRKSVPKLDAPLGIDDPALRPEIGQLFAAAMDDRRLEIRRDTLFGTGPVDEFERVRKQKQRSELVLAGAHQALDTALQRNGYEDDKARADALGGLTEVVMKRVQQKMPRPVTPGQRAEDKDAGDRGDPWRRG
jgi:hypothetical protein